MYQLKSDSTAVYLVLRYVGPIVYDQFKGTRRKPRHRRTRTRCRCPGRSRSFQASTSEGGPRRPRACWRRQRWAQEHLAKRQLTVDGRGIRTETYLGKRHRP
ncbi:hypothetical protein RB213_011401 [Colletotrichum asianum]